MAKKLVIEKFRGEVPRIPNEALAETQASLAFNTRLSNGEIRAYPELITSADAFATLSDLTTGYTNFTKVSKEDGINWMAWIDADKTSILETRYNDIEAYPNITIPTSTAVGVLNVLFRGSTTALVDDDEDGLDFVATRTFLQRSIAPPSSIGAQEHTVAVYLETELAPIDTYLWEFVSGDADITISDTAVSTPTFTCSNIPPPSALGIENAVIVEAIWRCTIVDTNTNQGQKQIKIRYVVYWEELASYGGGGGGDDDDGYYEQEK